MTTPSSPQSTGGRPRKILVVDDNPIIIKTLSLKLQSQGYEVLTALDGSQAVNAARTGSPDLIVLDINFPADMGVDWDGFRIVDWLRRIDESRSIPIIIITGGEPAKYKDRALAAGAVAFFQKPINNDELLAAISKALQGAGTPPKAGPAAPNRNFEI